MVLIGDLTEADLIQLEQQCRQRQHYCEPLCQCFACNVEVLIDRYRKEVLNARKAG